MGEAAKPLLFEGFQAGCHVILRGGVALCDIPTCLITCRKCQKWRISRTKCSLCCAHVSRLESMVFLWCRRVYDRKLQNLSFSKVSKQVVMSFCVAGVALCDIPTCLITCRNFFCVAGATMHFTFYTLHFTLHTLHSTFYTAHSTLYTPHSTTLHRTLHFTRSTLLTPHFTLHTLHFRLHTPHYTLYTLHLTLYTPHFTFYTSHFTLYTLHFTLLTPHSTLSTPHSTLYTLHSTLYTLH